jgi:hypothetical protein
MKAATKQARKRRSRPAAAPGKISRFKAVQKNVGLIRRVSAKLREDSYVSPERRRVPFTV